MPHQPIPPTPPGGEHTEELLAMIAHELRRPLTAMLGALATLQQHRQALSTLQQQELLGIAHRQGEQLGRLLGQLLAAAGVDRGQGRPARRSLVDAAALAEESGRAARLAHADHSITTEVAGPLLVRVDPLAVSRILGNLLDNAAAYSPKGSSIRLSASREGVHAVLAVQDMGPGIPPADRDRIFQRYTRQGGCSTSPGGGLGLACTSPDGWLTPTAATCSSLTRQAAGVPGWSCACRWQHRRCRLPAPSRGSPPGSSIQPDRAATARS